MKVIINITLIALVTFTLSSCTKTAVPTEAEVTFNLDNSVDDKSLEWNTPFTYTNKAGNPYNVSELSYVISNVVLIDLGDNEISFNNIGALMLPNGTYKTMRFTVSSFKHVGKFLDGTNTEQSINIDFSAGGSETNIEIPVGGLTVNGAAKTAYISFNLNEVYSAATDFNNGATAAEVTPDFASAFSFGGSFNN